MANELAIAAERFVVGHELGHHLLLHTEQSHAYKRATLDLVEFNPSWAMELEADAFAAQLAVVSRAGTVENPDAERFFFTFSGIELFFLTLDLLTVCANQPWTTSTPTHPATMFRRDAVRAALGRFGDATQAFDHHASMWRTIMSLCFTTLSAPMRTTRQSGRVSTDGAANLSPTGSQQRTMST